MVGRTSLIAIHKLPFSIGFEGTVSGVSESVKVGNLDCRIILPRIDWINKEPFVVRPHFQALPKKMVHPNENDDGWFWGSVGSWNEPKKIVRYWWVNAVVFAARGFSPSSFQYSDYLYGRGAPEGALVDSLFEDVDDFIRSVGDWIEVFSDQDTGRDSTLKTVWETGAGLAVWTLEEGKRSLDANPSRVTITMHDAEVLDRTLWRRVLRLASKRTPVPEEHRLLIDARAAIRRSSFRRAVIDSGTAAELALRRLFETSLRQVPPTPRQELMATSRTLGALVALLRKRIPAPNSELDFLVQKRNQAVHRNAGITRSDAQKVVAITAIIVGMVEPLHNLR